MKRREFLGAAGTGIAGALAGCADNEDDELDETVLEEDEEVRPEERDFSEIDYDVDLPRSMRTAATAIEESIDSVVSHDYDEVNRQESYLDVRDTGVMVTQRDVGDEQFEIDKYGFSIELDSNKDMDEERIEQLAVDTFTQFIELTNQSLYEEGDGIPSEESITNLRMTIDDSEGQAFLEYGMPNNSGQSTGDLRMAYRKDVNELTGVEESVRQNFFYAEE